MIKFKFIWYDLWVGVFVDTKKKRVYVAPLPCCVVIVDLKHIEDNNYE